MKPLHLRLVGAETGRTTSSFPNYMGMPRQVVFASCSQARDLSRVLRSYGLPVKYSRCDHPDAHGGRRPKVPCIVAEQLDQRHWLHFVDALLLVQMPRKRIDVAKAIMVEYGIDGLDTIWLLLSGSTDNWIHACRSLVDAVKERTP